MPTARVLDGSSCWGTEVPSTADSCLWWMAGQAWALDGTVLSRTVCITKGSSGVCSPAPACPRCCCAVLTLSVLTHCVSPETLPSCCEWPARLSAPAPGDHRGLRLREPAHSDAWCERGHTVRWPQRFLAAFTARGAPQLIRFLVPVSCLFLWPMTPCWELEFSPRISRWTWGVFERFDCYG